MPITKGFQVLVDEAMAQVTTYSVAEVQARLQDPKVQVVDIRDIRELNDGTVVASVPVPESLLAMMRLPLASFLAMSLALLSISFSRLSENSSRLSSKSIHSA